MLNLRAKKGNWGSQKSMWIHYDLMQEMSQIIYKEEESTTWWRMWICCYKVQSVLRMQILKLEDWDALTWNNVWFCEHIMWSMLQIDVKKVTKLAWLRSIFAIID
jgi:hypothetical protein